MEELINQMRSKFSGGGQSQVSWSSSSFPRERRIPPQKSLSFKGEKKSSNWFQRQLSRQMSGSGSGTEDEVVAVAVAAAAFAVRNTLRDSTSATTAAMAGRAKSRKDREPQSPPPSLEPVRSSLRFSGEVRGSPENSPTTPSRDLTLQRRTTFADQLEEAEPPRAETPSPPKPLKHETPSPPKPLPSMKEPPSLGDKKIQVEPNTMRQPETPSPEPVVFPPIKQVTPSSAAAPPKPRASRGDSAADAWEKAEMERIKERYDKLSSTILSWEQDKKKKARAKLDRAESELSRKRAKALQKFKEEMEQIKEITEGARAQAEERRRNEELKTREKANKYRATGKLPRTCFCF